MTVESLRTSYPRFYYRSCSYDITDEGLLLSFKYSIEPEFTFTPSLLIPGVTQDDIQGISPQAIRAYVFHIGLVEMLSYWKTTCSPEIIIEAGQLDADQLAWWHELLMKGMGEFFYVNQIAFTEPNFVTLTCSETAPAIGAVDDITAELQAAPDKTAIMIPVGGGKDSIVTIELLKKYAEHQAKTQLPGTTDTPVPLALFLLNPTLAAQEVATQSGIDRVFWIRRQLDPQLDELNRRGFLNGHTPFSSLVAFITSLVARIYDFELIAVSNEHSSNEGNVTYLGQNINHQYSKSFEFETKFQQYIQTYISAEPENEVELYFSFMRPLYELQIAQLFAPMTEYHSIFRSCNRGRHTNSWCGECPKCIFTYVALYPFLGAEAMNAIFGQDLFSNVELLPIALDLLGVTKNKPFECVGTHEENKVAFYLSLEMIKKTGAPIPALLTEINDIVLSKETDLKHRAETLLHSWNPHHSIPQKLATFLREESHL